MNESSSSTTTTPTARCARRWRCSGQKWVPHIIHELMSGKRRFNELAHDVGGCNSRTLRDRLKNLEELEIVDRNIVAVMPPWVEYELTPKGEQLGEALRQPRSTGARPT